MRGKPDEKALAFLGRALGLVLLATAACAATLLEYPMDRELLASRSLGDLEQLRRSHPQPLEPRGELTRPPERFVWSWEGRDRDWTLVVVDSALEEVLREPLGSGCSVTWPNPEALPLQPGEGYYWWVETGSGLRQIRCAPVAFAMPQ